MRKQSRPASVIQPGHPGRSSGQRPGRMPPGQPGGAPDRIPVDLLRRSQCRHDEGNATTMRGIVSIAGYVPYRRLQRSAVAQVFGTGGGKGSRSVGSHDEDKTNATTIHAALRQPAHVAAFDFGGALRSGTGALRTALAANGSGTTLVVLSDLRDGLPTSADESAGGDGGAAAGIAGDTPATPA